MMSPNLAELMQYRVEQAGEALAAAQILLRAGSLRASVNRSYYAMFYAILALLAAQKEETAKHSGAIALFDRLYVHAGLFPTEFSKWLRRAFDLRTRCDYGAMVTITDDEASTLLEQATTFVSAVTKECRRLIESA